VTDLTTLAATIDEAFERRAELNAKNSPPAVRHAIEECIELLDSGQARVAEKRDGRWQVNQFLKKAVLLYFRTHDNEVMDAGYTRFFDKVPLKYAARSQADDGESLRSGGARVVPPAVARRGAYIAANTEVVEGVIVEEGSVISMGVYIGQSTRIYDRATGQILQGRIPAGSVVVSGNLPSADGKYSLYCAVIVKRVDAQTRAKTSINELLRAD
jgi:tetrahydrodipicolinate N-succinyltransferase